MNETQKSAKHPAWSPKKRVTVTLVGTIAILSIGLFIGTIIYFIGLKTGLFTSQSLKRLTLASLVEDKAFVEAIKQAQQSTNCENKTQGIKLSHPTTLIDIATKSAMRCTAFATTESDKPVVTINLLAIERLDLIEQLVGDSSPAIVDSFAHSTYPASSVRGNRQGLPFAAYILEIAPTQSLLVEVMPSLGQFERAGVAIAQSITLR